MGVRVVRDDLRLPVQFAEIVGVVRLLEASPGAALPDAARSQLMDGFSASFLVAAGLALLALLASLPGRSRV